MYHGSLFEPDVRENVALYAKNTALLTLAFPGHSTSFVVVVVVVVVTCSDVLDEQ